MYVHVLLCVCLCVMCVCVIRDVAKRKKFVKCWAEEHSACDCGVVCQSSCDVWCFCFCVMWCACICVTTRDACGLPRTVTHQPLTYQPAICLSVGLSDLEQTVPQCVHMHFPPPIFVHFSTVHQCNT